MNRTDRYRSARKDSTLAVLEGFHALKHALRFGADILDVAASDPDRLMALAEGLAPDIADRLKTLAAAVPAETFSTLVPEPPTTGVVALARRPASDESAAIDDPAPAPIVLLERPNHLGNIGAVVRVSAAAGASAVLTTGERDPWHPVAIRGSAGLHFAQPVLRVEADSFAARPLVALAPEGIPLPEFTFPQRAVLAFGSERHGLSETLLAVADHCVSIPMQPGVSSLNLATSVAVTLYQWQLESR